jgi:WD40 repeat protein/transcriptional regulator with XRE-family HTH domain
LAEWRFNVKHLLLMNGQLSISTVSVGSNAMNFAEVLEEFRKKKQLKQKDLAILAGLTPGYVNHLIKGTRKTPSYETIHALAEALQLDNEERESLFKAADYETIPVDTSMDSVANRTRVDWGDAPNTKTFYNREGDLNTLKQWVLGDRCQMIAVLGIGGMGKTMLTVKLVEQVQNAFKHIFWRSLQHAPRIEHILKDCLQFFYGQQKDIPEDIDEQIVLLLKFLREQRCLLVLDNIESVLQESVYTGKYREGYEGYSLLLHHLGDAKHQSCLLITSREKPKEVALLEGKQLPVRSMHLSGLSQWGAQKVLRDKGLFGPDALLDDLIHHYSGNPLALKLVSAVILEVFGGDVASFLEKGERIFGDIQDLLESQLRRLSDVEKSIMYWLAIEREAISPDNLLANMIDPIQKTDLLLAIGSLKRRSMIEGTTYFTLQPVIMEYVTRRFTEQIFKEIISETIGTLASHALLKVKAKDYVRDSQIELILKPLNERLLATSGKEESEKKLKSILTRLRENHLQDSGYAAGNILNLLIHLSGDLQGYDFSYLYIRQAYLQGIALPSVNFAHAHFVDAIFTDTFGSVFSVAWNAGSTLIAAGTANSEVRIWRASDGLLLRVCLGHTDYIRSIAFSPDGNTIVSGSNDQSIRIWDVQTGECLKEIHGHTGRVYSVAFSPDGKTITSGSEDDTIRIWNVQAGECLQVLQGHSNRVWSIGFSPDGKTITSGSEDNTIRIWDVQTGQCFRQLLGHSGWIYSVAFSPDGQTITSGSEDNTIRIWDVQTGECLKILRGHASRVYSVAFSPDGQTITSGSEDNTIRMWDVQTGQCFKILRGHQNWVWSVAVSPDGSSVASGSHDQSIRIWNAQTGQCLHTLRGYNNWVYSIAFNPGGNTIASGNYDQSIRIWDVQTGKCLQTLHGHSNRVWPVAYSPDGCSIASGSHDQSIRIWDTHTGECLKVLLGHKGWIYSVAFSLDGKTIASGSHDKTIRLWNVQTGECLKTLQGHDNRVWSVAFSPDGNTIISGSDDHSIRIWDTHTGDCLKILLHSNRIYSVAFSPDGNSIASGSDDHSIRIWDTHTGDCLKIFPGHQNWVWSVAYSPDGKIIASSSRDGTIRLWDVQTGECLKTLDGHSGVVYAAAFSPDGKTIASGSEDNTIRLWDVLTGECFKTLKSDKPYENMNITGVKGFSVAQKDILKVLGAFEH